MSKIQGETLVYASPYIAFDPLQPEKAKVAELTYSSGESTYLSDSGYVKVGTATINVTFNTIEEITVNAVKAIEAEQASVLAGAQMKHTKLEQRKQELLALKG